MRDLFGECNEIEVLPPDDHDGELLAAWDTWRFVWRRCTDGKDTLTAAEHRALVRELDQASVRVLKSPARSLEGVRAKLAMALCSGPDAEVFLRRFVHGHRLPEIMPLADFASSQVLDALAAVEHLMVAEDRAGRPS